MRRAPFAVALVAGLLLAGCGIPDNTDVVPLRPGPSTGISSGDDVSPPRNVRADTTDPAEFAKNYLAAAAGDFAGAAERVKQFLSPDAAANFKVPGTEIKVVRLTEEPLVNPGKPVVIRTREVGTLGPTGILEPSADDRAASYELALRQIDGQEGLFVTNPPKVLLLSDSALNRFYSNRTIYFWNQDNTGLVPDVRYLPVTMPREQQPTEIIDWLTTGPSPWLRGVAETLPEGTKQIGNVPAISNQTLQISLSGQALDPEDPAGSLDRLQKQLRWSLWPNLQSTLHLTIEHQVEQDYTGTDYLAANAAYRATSEPERFVVYNGEIRRLSRSYNAGLPVPIIKPEDNHGVRMAAMSSSGNRSYAALVVNESGGRQVLKVGAAGSGEKATLRRIKLPGAAGRPVWAKSLDGADGSTLGLITAGGKLYSFGADGSNFGTVEWSGRPGPITAVAVAPDARRVALLAGGRLYVAALTGGDGAQLSSPHVVRTELRSLTAVDWSSEGVLVVSGMRADERVAIMEVSIDGADQTDRMPDLGSNPVTYLAAVPANPSRGEDSSGAIAYVLGTGAFDEGKPGQLEVADLAQPVADPPKDVLPSAPFFLN